MDWQLVGHDLETSSVPEHRMEVILRHEWEAVGPFPSGMREHALTRSPLTAYAGEETEFEVWFARLAFDETTTWPSDLPAGGRVGWAKFRQADDGWTEVVYPEVNWRQLRADHGWASLQYEAILRTELEIAPGRGSGPAGLLIDSSQLVEYAFVPQGSEEPVEWYNGDIYDFANTPGGRRGAKDGSSSNFARSITLEPGKYTVLVRVLYEIRMFGDPGANAPTIRFKLDIQPDPLREVTLVSGLNIVPDAVDGSFMGDWVAVGVRVPAIGLEAVLDSCAIVQELSKPAALIIDSTPNIRIAAGQTRRIPLRIRQTANLDKNSTSKIRLRFALGSDRRQTVDLIWHMPIRQRSRKEYFKFTFDPSIKVSNLAGGQVSSSKVDHTPSAAHESPHIPPQVGYAIAFPPPADVPDFATGRATHVIPVTLGLHGAGVDVEWEVWIEALPKTGGWTVLPTGKNEWGEDWHGASMQDAWAARDALHDVVRKSWGEVSDQTLVIGHSNGGQGAWHIASRYPDRVVGVIGAAGYVKVQDYVPYTETVSSHFADPALVGILNASLTPSNNDLYLSNLANVPCLALHGGADKNVPPRHSRVYASTINSWSRDKDAVEVVEVDGEDHWWDDMLNHPRIMHLVRRVVLTKKRSFNDERVKGFTLTTACVEETGCKAGIHIIELATPGKRLGRLDVFTGPGEGDGPESVQFRGTNIKRIDVVSASTGRSRSFVSDNGVWHTLSDAQPAKALLPARGPLIRLLTSKGPVAFILGPHPPHHSLAKRLAHDLFVYHRLDSEIISADQAIHERFGGNIVIIGRPEDNAYLRRVLQGEGITPVSFPQKGMIQIDTSRGDNMKNPAKAVYEDSAGIISLLPHPTSAASTALLIAGNSDAGTEAAARLFPLRTGVPIPDWVVVGPKMAYRGAGGIIGAGFWAQNSAGHKYNPVMSWFDR